MTNVVWPVNAVTGAPAYSGRMQRQAMSVALGGATAARPLGARSGVRPGTPASTVALPTATSYVIHPHAGVLDTQASAVAGPYWYAISADETGTVNAAHGTWPRKDILWVRIDDPGETDGSSVPAIVTGYTAGTAAASPAVPATPARAMRLATISVPLSGGGSPTIVFDAPELVADGGTSSSYLLFTPGSNLNTPTSGTATWITLGNVTVPGWATSADVTYSINGIYESSAAMNVAAVMKIGTVDGAVNKRIVGVPPFTTGYRSNLPIMDTFTGLTPGVKSVTIFATWSSGAGTLRIDATSYVVAQFTWRP